MNADSRATIKRRTITAIVWMFVANSWGTLAAFVTFALLARILDPFTFGTFALAQLLIQTIGSAANTALADTVIQRENTNEDFLCTVFYANLILSVGIALALWQLADGYATLTTEPAVAGVLKLLVVCLPLDALAAIHMARKLKDFGHRVVTARTMTSSLVGGVVAIFIALNGGGIWSLILQAWITSALGVGFAWATFPWLPRPKFSWIAVCSVGRFFAAVTFSRLIWVTINRIPEIFIGRELGAAVVGQFRIVIRLMELLSQAILHPIGSVAFAAFSRTQGSRLGSEQAYVRMLGFGALLGLPVFCGVGILSNDLISLLFGAKWQASAAATALFPLLAFAAVFNFLVIPVLMAAAEARALTFLAVAHFVVTLCTAWIAAPFGLVAVFAGHLLRNFALIPYQQWLLYRLVGIRTSACWAAIRVPLICALVMTSLLWLTTPALHQLLGNGNMVLLASILIGAATYVASLLILGRTLLKSYINELQALWNARSAQTEKMQKE